MANYTAYKNPDVEFIWHIPTAPFFLLAGYGRNYGRWYGNRGPEYTVDDYSFLAGYGRKYGHYYGIAGYPDQNLLSPKGWDDVADPREVSYTNNLPIDMPANSLTGFKAPTLTDVFYNRLSVEPMNIDFGILVSTQSRYITVWNGYLSQSIDLDDILLSGFEGMELVGDTPPLTFLPMEERIYELQATTNGPPTIDGRITFDWEAGFVDNYVYIIGIRIVMYPYLYRPDMIENLEWLTNVLTSKDGSETRQSLRESPRQKFSIKSFIQVSEQARADNLIYGWGDMTWAIPIWGEGRHPTSVVNELDETIAVDTRFGDFRAGGEAVIWQNERAYDLFTIVSFTDDEIVLDRGISFDFNLNSIVCPIRIGRMSKEPKRVSKGHNAVLSLIFESDDNICFATSASPTVFLSEDTYLDQPDKPGGNTFKDTYFKELNIVDYKTGMVTQYSPWDYTKIGRAFLVTLEGLEAIWNFRLWLHRRAGKQRPFYMPTYENNMRVAGTGNMATSFTIWNDENQIQAEARDHIYIKMKDGTEYLRTVIDIYNVDDDQTMVTIDTAISRNKEDVDYISYMGLKRISSDRIQLKWKANDIVECVVPIKEVTP